MNEIENKTFADVIVELRKEKGFTQQDLANKLHITDKAVSKWERGLSYPDITSISTLANVLDVDSSYLIDLCKSEDNPYLESDEKEDIKKIIQTILKGIGLAMGVSVAVLNIMNQLSVKDSIIMLSIGLACLGISSISNEKSEEKKLIKRKPEFCSSIMKKSLFFVENRLFFLLNLCYIIYVPYVLYDSEVVLCRI